jgi:hypothetical protein
LTLSVAYFWATDGAGLQVALPFLECHPTFTTEETETALSDVRLSYVLGDFTLPFILVTIPLHKLSA